LPSEIFAAWVHASILTLIAAGTVTVRRRFPLSHEIRNNPPSFALLDLVDFEADELGAAQPAGDQKRPDGAVALALSK